MKDNQTCYDVCIIGAGPAGLASLSAVHEPYSIDNLNAVQVNRAGRSLNLHKRLKVCVIDVHDTWLYSWQKNFEALDIKFLRSPALAHPNLFDKNELLAYAVANGRTDELLDSGCIDGIKLRAMGQSQTSLWKLPSTPLFVDFCKDLAKSLPHDFIQGSITDIANSSASLGSPFRLELDGGQHVLSAKAVILATGPTGRSSIPPGLKSVPPDRGQLMLSWTELDQVHPKSNRILVVGGGLTAVQVALKLCKLGKTCILCSRRHLVERHFDIGLEWFELRTANKCMSDFYYQNVSDRLTASKAVRGGGSVPPLYMREVERAERSGRLIRVIGEATYEGLHEDEGQVHVTVTNSKKGEKRIVVDQVVVACGLDPDCEKSPVVKSALKSWPIPVYGGLPSITEDLRWKESLPLYVVGGLGALNVGPDAGNLMGIRRAAQLVANELDCRCWLREEVLTNPFDAFNMGYSSSEDESDDDSNGDSGLEAAHPCTRTKCANAFDKMQGSLTAALAADPDCNTF